MQDIYIYIYIYIINSIIMYVVSENEILHKALVQLPGLGTFLVCGENDPGPNPQPKVPRSP